MRRNRKGHSSFDDTPLAAERGEKYSDGGEVPWQFGFVAGDAAKVVSVRRRIGLPICSLQGAISGIGAEYPPPRFSVEITRILEARSLARPGECRSRSPTGATNLFDK
jgi:hypothetical protein